METYGGRLSTSTRSRAVKNSHGTAAHQLEQEEKNLDKLKTTARRSMGREEEKIRKRLEKLELDRGRSSRSLLSQEEQDDISRQGSATRVRSRHERGSLQIQNGVDVLANSGTSLASNPNSGVALNQRNTRRESLPARRGSKIDTDTVKGRDRAMSLAPGADKKNVSFAGAPQARLCLNENKLPVIVPFIQVSGADEEDAGSGTSLHSPGVSRQSVDSGKQKSDSDSMSYTMAFKAAESANDMESSSGSSALAAAPKTHGQQPLSSPDLRGRPGRTAPGTSSTTGSSATKATMDLKALKELEELLKDSRHYTNKKYRQLDIGPESSTLRLQRKRMNQLEQILTSLKPTQRREPPSVEFDPMEVLNCSYLRLSKHNVEQLEKMVRESGRDPGIHPHSDVSNFRLFEDEDKSVTAITAKAD